MEEESPQPDPLTLEMTTDSNAGASIPIPRDREASMATDSSNASTDSAASVHESRRPETEKRRWPLGLMLASIGAQSVLTNQENKSLVHRKISVKGSDRYAIAPTEEKDSIPFETAMMAREIDSPRRLSGLLRPDQVQLVKKKDSDRYEIAPMQETLSFEEGFSVVIRACQLLAQKNTGLIFIGVAGPSGAGKTVFTDKGLNFMPGIAVISMDNYNDTSRIIDDGNFDDPRLTDYATLLDNIQGLKAGKAVQIPIYDFKTSSRIGYRTLEAPSSRIVVIEGIYALSEKLRPLLDLRVSINGGVHFDLVKRVLRDIQRASQEPEEIIHQISEAVYPMYKAFIERDLKTAHIKIINKFNPSSGTPTYILKSSISVTAEQIKAVLSEEYKESKEETYDIYLLPPGEDPEACQSYPRMRNRDGKYNLMFEVQGRDRSYVKHVAENLGLDGSYIPRTYLEQIQLEKLVNDVMALPDDLKTKLSLDDDLVSSPKEALSRLSADRRNKYLSRNNSMLHAYSTQRDTHINKLTKLAVNNRSFDGRTTASSATPTNQGAITQLSEQISTLNERMEESTSRMEELYSKFCSRKVSASQQNLALHEGWSGSGATSLFVSGLGNGSLAGSILPNSSSSPQLARELPLMEEILLIARGQRQILLIAGGQRQIMHQLGRATSLFVSGLGNGSLTGSILPNSSSSPQLTRESPLMEEILLMARGQRQILLIVGGQRQIMHQLDNLSYLVHEFRGERSSPGRTERHNREMDIETATVPLVLTLAIGGLAAHILLVSTGEVSTDDMFDIEAQDYISGDPSSMISLPPAAPDSPLNLPLAAPGGPLGHPSDTPPAAPGGPPNPPHEPPISPQRIWTVIRATGVLEISRLDNSQVIEACRLGVLEKEIILEGDMLHPSYVLPRAVHTTVVLPQILSIIGRDIAYLRICDGHIPGGPLRLLARSIVDGWLVHRDRARARFDLHVMEFLFWHTEALLKKKANFDQSSVATSAPVAISPEIGASSTTLALQPNSMFDTSSFIWLCTWVVGMFSPIWSPLCARVSQYYHGIGEEKRNDIKRMKDMQRLIKETRNIKEAAETCWGIFSVEERTSSYIPYVISRFEDRIRVLSDSLEEYESKRCDKSLKREIIGSSCSSISGCLGILATASVGLKHESAGKAQIALFVIGCLLLVVVVGSGIGSYFL